MIYRSRVEGKDVCVLSKPMKLREQSAFRLGWGILTILYAGIFLTILVLAYTGRLPSFLSGNDKLGHLVLYFLATYLGHRILNYRRVNLLTFPIPLFPLLFGIFTVVEEFLQALSPNRSFDGIDLIASFAGIWLGYWLGEKGNNVRGER